VRPRFLGCGGGQGGQAGTQPDLTACYHRTAVVVRLGRGPASSGFLTHGRDQRRIGSSETVLGMIAPPSSGVTSFRATNLLRSDDTEARNDILGCFGRSDRSSQGCRPYSRCGRHRARRRIGRGGMRRSDPARENAIRPGNARPGAGSGSTAASAAASKSRARISDRWISESLDPGSASVPAQTPSKRHASSKPGSCPRWAPSQPYSLAVTRARATRCRQRNVARVVANSWLAVR
jgi:hypothetical protein